MALDAQWNFSGCGDGVGDEQISSPFPISSSLVLKHYFVFFLSHFIMLCSRVVYLSLILHNNCEFLGGRDYGLFISIFSLAPLVSLGNGLFISLNRY